MSSFDDLVGDLAAQLDATAAAELAAEVEDRTRLELARVRMVDRLRAALDAPLRVDVRSGSLSGVLEAVGADWLLLREAPGRQALVPLPAVVRLSGLPRASAAPANGVAERLDLGFALRRLVRDRATLAVTSADGRTRTGRAERAAADLLDLVEENGAGVALATAGVDVVRWV